MKCNFVQPEDGTHFMRDQSIIMGTTKTTQITTQIP